MIEVVNVNIQACAFRMGCVLVKYHELLICCDLCLYKDQNFWIRMPETWVSNKTKRQFVFWDNLEKSDDFQKEVLKKVFDVIPLTLESAIKMRKDFFAEKKKMTLKKKQTTLT